MSQRKGKILHKPSEAVELDGDLSFPHTPMHLPLLEQTDSEDMYEEERKKLGLKGDKLSVCLLIFLYVLQGIPLGLGGSIPYLLSSRNVSYKDQATFSFVYWPFSVKLLWAPIVDAAYFTFIGRRKSWLIPIQYLIGIFMLVLSPYIPGLMGEGEGAGPVNITTLTIVFFMLNFLAATQDIAVDGWALTMLSRRNVGWASTCNTVGQTAGYFLGNVVFLALESPEFCNNYLRSVPGDKGVVTLSDFLYFWGIIFVIATTIVFIFKREDSANEDEEQGIADTYVQLWGVVRLPAIIKLLVVLLTCKIGFAAADAVTGLKLIEEGVPREKLALLGVPMVPIQIILPFIIGKYTAGPRPMDIFLKAMPFRLCMGLIFAAIVYLAPITKVGGEYPFYFYCIILFVYAIHQIFLYSMFVSQMAFFAKVSDPLIGGTYMTLLNTITNFGDCLIPFMVLTTKVSDPAIGGTYMTLLNTVLCICMFCAVMSFFARIADRGTLGASYMTLLNVLGNIGGNWPATTALYMVDFLTWKRCDGGTGDGYCDTALQQEACTESGGSCVTTLDGYYVESIFCVIMGLLWMKWRSKTVRGLQDLGPHEWSVSNRDSSNRDS